MVLIAIVVIAVGASSRLGGMRLAGVPVASAGLGAPAVGECLAVVTGPVSVGLPMDSIVVTSVGNEGVRFADCADPHLGEVVAVRTSLEAPFQATTNEGWCAAVATGHRSQVLPPVGDAVRHQWKPAADARIMLVLSALPGPKAFRWAACALVSPRLELYRGLFLGSLTDGPVPAPFGVCLSTGGAVEVSCDTAHRVQVFGTRTTPTTPTVDESCRGLIAAITGMPDITAGGKLEPVVFGLTGPDKLTPTTTCRLSVVGNHALSGTLVGVGDGPLPWIS